MNVSPPEIAKTGSPDSGSGRPSFVPSVCVCEKQSANVGRASRLPPQAWPEIDGLSVKADRRDALSYGGEGDRLEALSYGGKGDRLEALSYVLSRRNPDLALSLTAFARWRSRRAPQQRDLADRSHIKDMNPVPGVDDCRGLLLRQKDLLGVFHGNRLAIHSNLERTERARFQGGFQVGDFHPGKSKPGGSEGKPRRVRLKVSVVAQASPPASAGGVSPPATASHRDVRKLDAETAALQVWRQI